MKKIGEKDYILVNVKNNVQDKTSIAWQKLCEYVDKIAEDGSDEFSPCEYLGQELYAQIYTLPASIAKLKKVKKVWLYGSKLKRVPPEIGEMEALEYFDPYTSYDLHWFPYEITNCKNLKDSRVSTRALYGHKKPFPDLTTNPVRYETSTVACSCCKKEMTYAEIIQLWISLLVGTDVLPLLVNVCSNECKDKLPKPSKSYLKPAHKGGEHLKQPLEEHELVEIEWQKRQKEIDTTKVSTETTTNESNTNENIDIQATIADLPIIKLVRKIWEK